MRIGTREIGPSHEPYVIAEIGVNHDGDADRAVELTRLAANAGADAVKFQLFEADKLMSEASVLAAYQRDAGEHDPREMLRRLQLSVEQLAPAVKLAKARGVHVIVSVFSAELVGVAQRAPQAFDAYKTASPDIVHKPLLEALAATGKPLILSTGAATLDEVSRALHWLKPIAAKLAVLQCVSCYPTPMEHAGLGGVRALRDLFAGPVGYSDHTEGEETGALAVVCGAAILEKHFTDNSSRVGPDHRASLGPEGFARYTNQARGAWRMLMDSGKGMVGPTLRELLDRISHVAKEKVVLAIEEDVRKVSRQSLVARRNMRAGHVVGHEDVTFKRPGTGLLPFELNRVIGAALVRDVRADMPLYQEDFALKTGVCMGVRADAGAGVPLAGH